MADESPEHSGGNPGTKSTPPLGVGSRLLFVCSSLVDSRVTPESGDLVSFIATEQQRGSVLTYTQSYTDDQNERVSYAGTLYTGIRLFKLDECQVIARVAVEDRFSGRIGHRNFGRVQADRRHCV